MFNKPSALLVITFACSFSAFADTSMSAENTLNVGVTTMCGTNPTNPNNSYSFTVDNNDSVEIACHVYEYTFDPSKNSLSLSGVNHDSLMVDFSFTVTKTFVWGFPEQGVLLTVLCQAGEREFRDSKFFVCPSH